VSAEVLVLVAPLLVSAEVLVLVAPLLVSAEVLVLVAPPLVSTEALVEPPLVSTEALVEPPLVSTEALVEPPLVSTEAVVEPVGRELVSSAWAMPGRTPPKTPVAPRIDTHRRIHRRRQRRPMPLTGSLRPNDLSRSCTHDLQGTGQASCLPFRRIYPFRTSRNSLVRSGKKYRRPNDVATARASVEVTRRITLTALRSDGLEMG